MNISAIEAALTRRLPSATTSDRKQLARSYLDGVSAHALDRTTGAGPVPTTLATERAELVAHVCRSFGRLLTEDEISALLRVTTAAAKSVRKTMLAVYDDIPVLALKAAFAGAKRDGRGSKGDVTDGYRIKFATAEKLEIAQDELDRQGYKWELVESSGSRHLLLIDAQFPIDEVLSK